MVGLTPPTRAILECEEAKEKRGRIFDLFALMITAGPNERRNVTIYSYLYSQVNFSYTMYQRCKLNSNWNVKMA